jgi:sugar phosphate isomerase/epimerase
MKSPLTRRNFLRSGAIAAATLATSSDLLSCARTPSPADSSFPIRLGLATYTFRNFTRAQLIGFAKELRVLALNAKDVKDHLPADPEKESSALADYAAAGAALHAVGMIPFDKNEDADIRAKFLYAQRGGVRVIVAGDPAPGTLSKLEKFAQEFDMRIAIHNHGPEDKLWASPLDVLRAIQEMGPRLGCCIDVGHTVRAGTDVIQAIHAAGPRLFNMHMKDLRDFNDRESQVAVGEGLMPVQEIFSALLAVNYQGFVDLEYEVHPDDPMPGVTRSFAYLRGLLAKM